MLDGAGISGIIQKMAEEKLESLISARVDPKTHPEDWDWNGLRENCMRVFGFRPRMTPADLGAEGMQVENLSALLKEQVQKSYAEKEALLGQEDLRNLERLIMLQIIDQQWVAHLQDMESMKEGIGLRGYGQMDPLKEYQKEGYALFEGLTERIREEILSTLFRIQLVRRQPPPEQRRKPLSSVTAGRPPDPLPCVARSEKSAETTRAPAAAARSTRSAAARGSEGGAGVLSMSREAKP